MTPDPRIEVMKTTVSAINSLVRLLDRQISEAMGMPADAYVVSSEACTHPDMNGGQPIPTPPDPTWFPVMHVRNTPSVFEDGEGNTPPPACGQVALYLTRRFRADENASLDLLRMRPPGELGWRRPTPNDIPVCSTCHRHIDPWSSQHLNLAPLLESRPIPPPAPGVILRRPEGKSLRANNALRRSRSAPEAEPRVRFTPDLLAGQGDSSPGTQGPEAPEPTQPVMPEVPFSPEVAESVVRSLNDIADSVNWAGLGFPEPPHESR